MGVHHTGHPRGGRVPSRRTVTLPPAASARSCGKRPRPPSLSMAERRIGRWIIQLRKSRTEGDKLMTDDFDTLLKNSEPFTVSAWQLRGSAFLGHRNDGYLILDALEADLKRDRAFAKRMTVFLGAIMAVLAVVVIEASVRVFDTMDAPAVSGFETIVR